MLLPLFLFSQESELVSNTSEGFKGISIGLLFEAQTKYPNPYYGPNVGGLFDDGSYHFTVDVYYKKFVFGFQLSDEFLYFAKFSEGHICFQDHPGKSYFKNIKIRELED